MNKRQIYEKNVFEYDNANCIIKAQTFYKAVCHTKRLPSIYSEALILLHFFNYSMIEATRPEPTVRPPSRFVGNKIIMFFHVFHWILYSYSLILAILFEVFKFFRTKIEPQTLSALSNKLIINS